MPRLSVVLSVVALLGAQVAPAQVAPPTLQSEVEAAVTAYVEGHNRLSVAALAELYSRDSGVTSIGDGEILWGWERIRTRARARPVGGAGAATARDAGPAL